MKRLKKLNTAKRTYADIPILNTPQEATEAGYHILYYDEMSHMTIYGKPIDESFPRLLTTAAVPGQAGH